MSAIDTTIKKHYLYPSSIFWSDKQYIVDTVLGSCISVCLYNPRLKIGGINHFMLPLWNGEGLASPKFGNVATKKLIERMIAAGSTTSELQAKLFGGANQIKSIAKIGQRNIEIARKILADYQIKVVGENVGGQIGRKIKFDTGTGQVLMKMLKKK